MSTRVKGFLLIIIGASLWGAMGVSIQYLLDYRSFDPAWIASTRLDIAGAIILLFDKIYNKADIFAIWNKRDIKDLLIFSTIGVIGTQYCYILTISYSNAPTATILQYLMPIFILFYVLVKEQRGPRFKEVLCISLAIIGTFILITKGSFDSLKIAPQALFWGLISAVSEAVYTVQPKRMLKEYSTSYVIGWGMIIGGICMAFIRSPFYFTGTVDTEAVLAMLFTIFFGTIGAYWCYIESTKYLASTEVATMASIEPLSSVVLSIFLMHISFGPIEMFGSFLIVCTILILARK